MDARNHGESPHVYAMDYEAMAADCELLLHDLGIDKAAVLGHSMGGKVAISLALLKVCTSLLYCLNFVVIQHYIGIPKE